MHVLLLPGMRRQYICRLLHDVLCNVDAAGSAGLYQLPAAAFGCIAWKFVSSKALSFQKESSNARSKGLSLGSLQVQPLQQGPMRCILHVEAVGGFVASVLQSGHATVQPG